MQFPASSRIYGRLLKLRAKSEGQTVIPTQKYSDKIQLTHQSLNSAVVVMALRVSILKTVHLYMPTTGTRDCTSIKVIKAFIVSLHHYSGY